MQEKALSEAMGSLRRVADIIRSTSTEPQEPVRESLPKTKIKQVAIVAPRTPKPTNGGQSRTQCTGGDGTVFPAQDVREYTSKFWSGVRALQSKLLLVEIKALYKTAQLVTYINSLLNY